MFSSKNGLPRRIDSLSVAASSALKFQEIDEELHDVKRVHTHGQEEDLRMALSRMISRVEELSSMLKEAYRAQTDLQTELTLAKSNLQLSLANNEMLEDALNRDIPGSSKDVGWRRWGAKEQRERELEGLSRRSMDSSRSVDVSTPSPGQSPIPGSTPAEGRFFRFRFGGGTPSATNSAFPSPRLPASPRIGQAQSASVGGQFHTSHLTSASLPSLVPERDKEIETLTTELEKEKKARVEAAAAKEALEAELESLSQALFEEANKMVATERMRLAETVGELEEAHAEKEALRSALKLLEKERTTMEDSLPSSHPSRPLHTRSMSAVSGMSTSSAIAIKSPPSSSAPSSPISMRRVLSDPPTSGSTVTPTPVAMNHSAHMDGSDRENSPSHSELSHPERSGTSSPDVTQGDLGELGGMTTAERSANTSLDVPSTSTTPSSSSPRSSPSPNPSPAPSGFTYVNPRPVMFYEGDSESPWADARSAAASPAGMF